MTAFVAKLVVDPAKAERFEALQKELAELTRANEPGTLVYEVLRAREAENVYLVVARFADEAAFEHHQGTDFHDRLVPPILDCLAEEMELTFYDAVA